MLEEDLGFFAGGAASGSDVAEQEAET